MATTHRSDLIDELEKALRDEAYDGGMGSLSPEQFTDYVRGLAVTAAKVVDEAHTPTDDEREALADRLARRLIGDPKHLMLAEGTGALHVALSESVRTVIEDVYADCGDSDPGVLSSNIARRLAGDLPTAILADAGFRRSEVPEPSAGRELTPCGNLICTGCRVCGCPALGIEPQGEPSDAQAERARIIADLREWARPLGNSPEEDTLRLVIDRIERAAGGAR